MVLQSTLVAPERVREETALAPFLLQSEGLLVRMLEEALKEPVRLRILMQELDRVGFRRHALAYTQSLPLYLAVTIIRRIPQTQKLIRAVRKQPETPLGELLEHLRLYGHKRVVAIRQSEVVPWYRELFELGDTAGTLWERTYAIHSPRRLHVASVTELFSPRLEARLREHPTPVETT